MQTVLKINISDPRHPLMLSSEDVTAVNKCGHRLGQSMRPGAHAVDAYPFLRHFPSKSKRDGQEAHRIELALFTKQLQSVREGMKRGDGVDCFGRYLIEHQAGESFRCGVNLSSSC